MPMKYKISVRKFGIRVVEHDFRGIEVSVKSLFGRYASTNTSSLLNDDVLGVGMSCVTLYVSLFQLLMRLNLASS